MRYSVLIQWSPDDQCFVATCPELYWVAAHGDTQAEALAEFQQSLTLSVGIYEDLGEELPPPRYYE